MSQSFSLYLIFSLGANDIYLLGTYLPEIDKYLDILDGVSDDPDYCIEDTPLTYCAKNNMYEFAEFLLKNKVNPNIKNKSGNTPLCTFIDWNYSVNDLKFLELLLRYGADIHTTGEYERRPLEKAVYYGSLHIIEILLKYIPPSPIQWTLIFHDISREKCLTLVNWRTYSGEIQRKLVKQYFDFTQDIKNLWLEPVITNLLKIFFDHLVIFPGSINNEDEDKNKYRLGEHLISSIQGYLNKSDPFGKLSVIDLRGFLIPTQKWLDVDLNRLGPYLTIVKNSLEGVKQISEQFGPSEARKFMGQFECKTETQIDEFKNINIDQFNKSYPLITEYPIFKAVLKINKIWLKIYTVISKLCQN